MISRPALFLAVAALLSISCGVYWYLSERPRSEYRDSHVQLSTGNAKAATYGLYKGPGGEYCDGSGVISDSWSSGQDECESRCTTDVSCQYYSLWETNWCRLSTSCDVLLRQPSHVIKIFHKEPFTYLGCYADSGARDLPFAEGIESIEQCALMCKFQGYNFMGRQWKQNCFCGNSFGKYGETSGCDCYSSGNIGLWKQCIYHLPTKCTGGTIIPNSDRTESSPCRGTDGEECAYQCNPGYIAVGRHVCQTYSVSGVKVSDHAFFGGRCDKLCDSVACETPHVPVRMKSTTGQCLQTMCMEPDQALFQLTKGGYELFQMGRNPRTGIYIDHVDVRLSPESQSQFASIDGTALGIAVECVAAHLGIISMQEAEQKVLTTMRALAGKIDGFSVPRNPRGILPHFIDADTGKPYGDTFETDGTGMFGVGTMFVKTCFENADPGSAATQEISALAEQMNAAIQYDSILCDSHGKVTGEGVAIPYVVDDGDGCSNTIAPGSDGYFYYNEMMWVAYLAYHQACGKQPKGECSNKPIERMWEAWQGRRKNLWYYWGGRGLLTVWPSFLLQLPYYMVHAFNSDPIYTELFGRQWQAEWDYYKSDAFYAGEDGRYGLGAGPTISWCAGTTYSADMFVNYTDGTAQFCRMYSPYAVAGYLPASPSVIREHLLALLSSGDASYRLQEKDLFVLWRKSLIDRDWAQDDWGITLVDFASEFFGLSTLWLGSDFYKKTTNHWPDDLPDSGLIRRDSSRANRSRSAKDLDIEYI